MLFEINSTNFFSFCKAFFLYRIPKLQTQLGVQVEERSTPSLLLSPVLSALRDVCHVKRGIDTKTRVVFNDLKNEVRVLPVSLMIIYCYY